MDTWRRSFLIGAGAVLLSIAAAQTPPTYTPIGAGIVAGIEGSTSGTVGDWVQIGGTGSGTTSSAAVSWALGAEFYLGAVAVPVGTAFDEGVRSFYTVTCLAVNQDDCGRMRKSIAPEVEPSTGSSLDLWWDRTQERNEWAFVSAGHQAVPSTMWFVDNVVDDGTSAVAWGTGVHTYGSPSVTTRWCRGSAGGASGAIAVGDVFTTSAVCGTSGSSAFASAQTSSMNGHASAVPPRLDLWRTGAYWEVNGLPTAHPDTVAGVRVALAELAAEFDRRLQYGWLPAGLAFDPVPTAEQLAGSPPEPEDPGGGEPPVVDPGTCDEGWFLTRVVCEIRDYASTSWEFISHDAWVPEVGWSERADAMRGEAMGRAPFGMLSAMYLGNVESVMDDAGALATPCPVLSINTAEWLGTLFPAASLEGVQATTWDPCDNPYADWMHAVGRQLLLFLSAGFMAWRVARMVMGVG